MRELPGSRCCCPFGFYNGGPDWRNVTDNTDATAAAAAAAVVVVVIGLIAAKMMTAFSNLLAQKSFRSLLAKYKLFQD